MSREQKQELYFRLLKERWEKTNKNSRQAIHNYNEWKRQLRHDLMDED